MKARYFFILAYLLLLFVPAYTVWRNGTLAVQDATALTYLFLRLTGLYGFILIFVQIMIGAYMDFARRVFGPRILNFHIQEGFVAYGLILAHPVLFLLNKALAGAPDMLDLLVPRFTTSYEVYLSFGKFGFILLTIAVLATRFRKTPFLQKHWRKLHILNYVAFWLIFSHSFNVGSDTQAGVFSWLYPVMAILVIFSIFYRRVYIPFIKPARVP
jgi:predicted ferric reductase